MHFQKRLASGLMVVGERMPHLRSVSVGLWVNAGSLHERPEENGISHFIEHMVFNMFGAGRRVIDRGVLPGTHPSGTHS